MKKFIGFIFVFVFAATLSVAQTPPQPTSDCAIRDWPYADNEMWMHKDVRHVVPGSMIQVPVSFGIASDGVVAIDARIDFSSSIRPLGWWNFFPYNFCPPSVVSDMYSEENKTRILIVGYPLINKGGVLAGTFNAFVDYNLHPGDTIVAKKTLFLNDNKVLDDKDEYFIVASKVLYGDLNNDSALTSMDVAGFFEYLNSNIATVSTDMLLKMDLSGDYQIDWYDLYLEFSRVLGKIHSFPVEGNTSSVGGGGGKGIAVLRPSEVKIKGVSDGSEITLKKVSNGQFEFKLPEGAIIEPFGIFYSVSYGIDGTVHIGFTNGEISDNLIIKVKNASPESIQMTGKINEGIPIKLIVQKTTDVIEQNNVPENFSLSQNYPNPFNPSTRISFGLPQNIKTTLKVYDMLGREMVTLVNGELSAGNHEAVFDASGLSSGIYIYRLTAGEFTETKRMNLLK